MLPPSTDILIVGAGPAGLATAASLVTHGFKNIIIVDSQSKGENTSRAVVIHAQTMECLETIGCASQLSARGIHAKHMTVRSVEKTLIKGNFGSLSPKTEHPYALLISQSDTESILEERLAALDIHVQRPYKVSTILEKDDGLTVSFASGETIFTKCLIGADGARSIVRQSAGIPYVDPKSKKDPYSGPNRGLPFIIADVTFRDDRPMNLPRDELSVLLGPNGLLLAVPLPHREDDPEKKTIFRLSLPLEKGSKEVRTEYLQEAVITTHNPARGKTPEIETVIWSSRFKIRSAMAKTFFRRYTGGAVVLLVGDAAHMHSPAGGQGMNLGIRDSIELGAILAPLMTSGDIAKPKADELLRQFSAERRKLAGNVIKLTKVMTWATGLSSVPARKTRNSVWWLLGRSTKVKNGLAFRLSGLGAK